MAESLVQMVEREIRGERCLCGAPKGADRSFCKACYFALPERLRAGLFARGQALAVAHDEAKTFLQCETTRLTQGRLL